MGSREIGCLLHPSAATLTKHVVKKSGLVSMAVVSLGAACKLEADDASDW